MRWADATRHRDQHALPLTAGQLVRVGRRGSGVESQPAPAVLGCGDDAAEGNCLSCAGWSSKGERAQRVLVDLEMSWPRACAAARQHGEKASRHSKGSRERSVAGSRPAIESAVRVLPQPESPINENLARPHR